MSLIQKDISKLDKIMETFEKLLINQSLDILETLSCTNHHAVKHELSKEVTQ